MTNPIRRTEAVLVIVDISGYTQFVQKRVVSLEHAEAIVTELIESIIDCAEVPLVINKLEGDAALLYAETHGDAKRTVASALRQVAAFFAAFATRLERINAERSHCDCDACANIDSLRLKALLHVGEIVVKQVRNFEEIAGEPVILVHRMAKNSLPLHEYVLMSNRVVATGGATIESSQPLEETIDGAAVSMRWCGVDALVRFAGNQSQRVTPLATPVPAFERVRTFHHLPLDGERRRPEPRVGAVKRLGMRFASWLHR